MPYWTGLSQTWINVIAADCADWNGGAGTANTGLGDAADANSIFAAAHDCGAGTGESYLLCIEQ